MNIAAHLSSHWTAGTGSGSGNAGAIAGGVVGGVVGAGIVVLAAWLIMRRQHKREKRSGQLMPDIISNPWDQVIPSHVFSC